MRRRRRMTANSSIGEQLDLAFSTFEQETDWRLSLPAKVIIQQGFISIEMDRLGMGAYAPASDRALAVRTAMQKLPSFLDALKKEAENRPDDEKASKNIGGIFVLQHAKSWRDLFGCPCWPNN
jgi:hypothetical protein